MKKVIYVMNVDWNWIKQRPHFIAEELSQNYALTVMYQHRYNRRGYQKRSAEGLDIKPIYVIPRGDRIKLLRRLNGSIKNGAIRTQVKKAGADVMYLTFPDQVDAIPKEYTGMAIYDCMDNHPAFVSDPEHRKAMEQQEAALISRADKVLVSSQKLCQVLTERYGENCAEKLVLVRNGYNGALLAQESVASVSNSDAYTIAYFGTISSWFNFEYLQKSLDRFPNLQYLLIGPAEVEIPQYDRLKYVGTVEHSELLAATKDANCLMMPFVVNEIIESVDPVKLYEYINFGKDILCVKYPEVERFEPFVHFYTDYASFEEQLATLMARSEVEYSAQQRVQFLGDNSWACRADVINKLLADG